MIPIIRLIFIGLIRFFAQIPVRKIEQGLFIGLIVATNYAMAGDATPEIPKLTLTAHSTIARPADELQLSIGVVTMGADASVALADNSSKMESVIAALQNAGLTNADYQTGLFSIRPTYTPYPKEPPPDWKPSIAGYEVSNSIAIKTQKLELTGTVIDAASKAGANSIENVHFDLHDPQAYWHEALSLATANAIGDAQVIAAAAHVQLGRLLSVSLNNNDQISPRGNNVFFAKAMGSAESLPPIEAGKVDIKASINVTYELIP